MQTTRARVSTPRKERVWTSSQVQFALSVAGQPGTAFLDLGGALVAKLLRSLSKGDTISHLWVKGVWTQSAAGDSSREFLALGIGFFTTDLLTTDMPDLFTREGNLPLHDVRGLREPLALQDAMVTPQLATVDIESSGQRTVPYSGPGVQLRMYAQTLNAPSAGSFEFTGAVTCLWLV